LKETAILTFFIILRWQKYLDVAKNDD